MAGTVAMVGRGITVSGSRSISSIVALVVETILQLNILMEGSSRSGAATPMPEYLQQASKCSIQASLTSSTNTEYLKRRLALPRLQPLPSTPHRLTDIGTLLGHDP